jgi:hypothetical protein
MSEQKSNPVVRAISSLEPTMLSKDVIEQNDILTFQVLKKVFDKDDPEFKQISAMEKREATTLVTAIRALNMSPDLQKMLGGSGFGQAKALAEMMKSYAVQEKLRTTLMPLVNLTTRQLQNANGQISDNSIQSAISRGVNANKVAPLAPPAIAGLAPQG